MVYIPKHFVMQEFLDPQTFKANEKIGWDFFEGHDSILIMADGIRDFFMCPVIINNWHKGGSYRYRGFRPSDCTVGAKNSEHKVFRAIDFDVFGYTAEQVRQKILKNQDSSYLKLITRLEKDVNWVHADSKPLSNTKRIYLFLP